MTINYNIDHRLLTLPVFKEVKPGNSRIALLITLSMISHFTKHAGQCEFKQGRLVEDWTISKSYFSSAIKLLKKFKYIKCIRPYDPTTLQSAVFVTDTGYVKDCKYLYQPLCKPVSASDSINNPKKGLKGKKDGFNKPLPSNDNKQSLVPKYNSTTPSSWENKE